MSVALVTKLGLAASVTVSVDLTPRNNCSPAANVAINPAEIFVLFAVMGRVESSWAVGAEPPRGNSNATLALAFAPVAGVME